MPDSAQIEELARDRLGFQRLRPGQLPAVAALTYVPHDPLRPLAQTVPLPGWIASVTQIVGAAVPIYAPYSYGLQNGRFQTIP